MLKSKEAQIVGSGQRFESRIALRCLLKIVVKKCCQVVLGANLTWKP